MPDATAGPAGDRFRLRTAAGLTIEASTSPAGGLLQAFYAGYDRAFVLENEKEKLGGFAECLSLNEGESYRRLSNMLGPYREFIFLASDSRTGQEFGGGNFIAFPINSDGRTGSAVLSANLNYIFVNREARGLGYFTRLVSDLPEIVFRLFLETNREDAPADWLHRRPPVLVFAEQNDPYKLSRENYERDSLHSGLDQVTRIKIWARRGAKIVDFDYVQPALTADQEPDYNLAYSLMDAAAPSLSACLLREHLRRFFGISVLKGKDPSSDKVASEQFAVLDRLCSSGRHVELLPIDDSKLHPPSWQTSGGPRSLRDLLRRG